MSARQRWLAVALLAVLTACTGAAREQQRDEIEQDGGPPADSVTADSSTQNGPVPKASDDGQWYLAAKEIGLR